MSQSRTHPQTRLTRVHVGETTSTENGPVSGSRDCSVSSVVAQELDRGVGDQLRLRPIPSGAPSRAAAYTIRDVHSPESCADVQIRGAGRDRLGIATPFEAQVGSHVPRSDLTYIEAQDLGEVYETIIHDGEPSLIACAPHGGIIEEYTAQIAALVRKELGARGAEFAFVEDPFPLHMAIYDEQRVMLTPTPSTGVPDEELAALDSTNPDVVTWSRRFFDSHFDEGRSPFYAIVERVRQKGPI